MCSCFEVLLCKCVNVACGSCFEVLLSRSGTKFLVMVRNVREHRTFYFNIMMCKRCLCVLAASGFS